MASNQSIVLRLIHKATENLDAKTKGIMGKKVLQKSIYFFNLKHGCFNFKWADYGSFSEEAQQIVRDLEAVGKITIKDIKTKDGAVIKNMLYVKGSDDFEGFPAELDLVLDEIVKFSTGKGPRELEFLASVHFWTQKQQDLTDEYTVDYIHEKLTELKPNAEFTSLNVEGAIRNLEDSNFLAPITKE